MNSKRFDVVAARALAEKYRKSHNAATSSLADTLTAALDALEALSHERASARFEELLDKLDPSETPAQELYPDSADHPGQRIM